MEFNKDIVALILGVLGLVLGSSASIAIVRHKTTEFDGEQLFRRFICQSTCRRTDHPLLLCCWDAPHCFAWGL